MYYGWKKKKRVSIEGCKKDFLKSSCSKILLKIILIVPCSYNRINQNFTDWKVSL